MWLAQARDEKKLTEINAISYTPCAKSTKRQTLHAQLAHLAMFF